MKEPIKHRFYVLHDVRNERAFRAMGFADISPTEMVALRIIDESKKAKPSLNASR